MGYLTELRDKKCFDYLKITKVKNLINFAFFSFHFFAIF